LPLPPHSTLFPYTTLFRSFRVIHPAVREMAHRALRADRAADVLDLLDHLRRRAPRHQPDEVGGGAVCGTLADVLVDARVELVARSEEHTSELQSRENLVCR